MAPRASWKGRVRLGEIGFGVKLYTAATTSDRVALHMVNRRTGNRLRNEMVDAETGKPVADDDEVMGYEVDSGDYVLFEPEELASAVPESDKTLSIEGFLPCSDIDTLYLDRPLKGALLMQTLARVNRTFRGKEDGLLVSYAPLVDNLGQALAEYSPSGSRSATATWSPSSS